MPTKFAQLTEILDETSIMIRKPALEVISYIEKGNLNAPPNKFFFCILLLIMF